MKYKHATWRKLYRDEDGAFARLPWFARAAAAMLLKVCDDAGRIEVGDDADDAGALVNAVAFRQGATTGDRRMMRSLFPALFAEGYLVRRGRHVVVRNFVAAQRRWNDGEEAPPLDANGERVGRESDASETRVGSELNANGERVGSELETKPELSARKDSVENASARARARSSVPSSSDTTTQTGVGESPKPPSPARDVFEHWQRVMGSPRSVLDEKLARVVRAAIDRHGVDDCKRAVDGCFASDFHMNRPGGGNERGRKFNKLSVILRDAEQVAQFLDLAPVAAPAPTAEADPAARRPLRPVQLGKLALAAAPPLDDSLDGLTATLFGGNRG